MARNRISATTAWKFDKYLLKFVHPENTLATQADTKCITFRITEAK